MAKKIVEALWDCPYCGIKAIGGLTKHCPNCGHPQDHGTKFYMGEKKNYLDEELAAQYGQGADWLCPYCGSLNRVRYQYCANCGSPKEGAEKDYFSAAKPEAEPVKEQTPPTPVKTKRKPIGLIIVLLVIAALAFALWPRTYDAHVESAVWTRSIDIEAYQTFQESDWSVPAGGRITSQNREFHHYEQVFDHYETRYRQVAEDVYDGEDTHTYYSDNGDGTFTEETYTTPRYRTEYHTEAYQEPVYRDEPVYATKYYYDIDRWVVDRQCKSSGADDEPYWADYTLADNEREGSRNESYVLRIETDKKTYSVVLPQDRWEKFHKGDGLSLTVTGSTVKEINGEPVY